MAVRDWWARFREVATLNAAYEAMRAVTFLVGAWLIAEGGWRKAFPPYDRTSVLTLVGLLSVSVGVFLAILEVRRQGTTGSDRYGAGESPTRARQEGNDGLWVELIRNMREVLADREFWSPSTHHRGNIHRLTDYLSSDLEDGRDGWMQLGGTYDTAVRDLEDLFDILSHPSNTPSSGTFWSSYRSYKAIISLILKMGYALEDLKAQVDSEIPDYLHEEYTEFRTFFEDLRRRVSDLDRRMNIETGEEFSTLWP